MIYWENYDVFSYSDLCFFEVYLCYFQELFVSICVLSYSVVSVLYILTVCAINIQECDITCNSLLQTAPANGKQRNIPGKCNQPSDARLTK